MVMTGEDERGGPSRQHGRDLPGFAVSGPVLGDGPEEVTGVVVRAAVTHVDVGIRGECLRE
jgi:hypothetical protein